MSVHAQLMFVLKQHSYSLTYSRKKMFDILSQSEPLSMHDLYELCKPYMDRASVYRSIKVFKEIGLVQYIQIGWKHTIELSNQYQAHHHHLSCRTCGAVKILSEDANLENMLTRITDNLGYTSLDHQLEISGICKYCKVKKRSERDTLGSRKPHTSY